MTNVHVNRTLRELRTSDLVSFQDGRVTILDWAGLARAGEFDPAYLYLERGERYRTIAEASDFIPQDDRDTVVSGICDLSQRAR